MVFGKHLVTDFKLLVTFRNLAGSTGIIGLMHGAKVCLIAGLIALAACGTNIKTKEKVNEAVMERLRKSSGLDLNSLEVTTTSVKFNGNLASATVAFRPKGETSLKSGMVMVYSLEQRGNKWVVTKVGGSHGGSPGDASPGSSVSTLPPGHPPVSRDQQSAPAPGQGDGVRP